MRIQTEDVDAIANIHYKPINGIISFKKGDYYKLVYIKTLLYNDTTQDYSFIAKLIQEDLNSEIGLVNTTSITINSGNYEPPEYKFIFAGDDSVILTNGWTINGQKTAVYTEPGKNIISNMMFNYTHYNSERNISKLISN